MKRGQSGLAIIGGLVALLVISILIGRSGMAQGTTQGTVGGCPVGSPVASPEASPNAAMDASPVANLMASPEATPCPSPVTVAANEVTIEGVDINWNQKEVTIPANTAVQVVLPNLGQAPHNFSIDALGISVDMPIGQTVETTINAPAGTYEFYCNVPGHAPAGMVGTLTIE